MEWTKDNGHTNGAFGNGPKVGEKLKGMLMGLRHLRGAWWEAQLAFHWAAFLAFSHFSCLEVLYHFKLASTKWPLQALVIIGTATAYPTSLMGLGLLIRAASPWARMPAETRPRAMMARVPASSARRARLAAAASTIMVTTQHSVQIHLDGEM